MQYMLLIYEDERIYAPEKSGSAMQEIVAKQRTWLERRKRMLFEH
jgi:hypothetical protein